MVMYSFQTNTFYQSFLCQSWRSVWQFTGLICALVISFWLLEKWVLTADYGLALLPAIALGLILVKAFVIQHDCGHNAYFKSKAANQCAGMLLSFFTMAPSLTALERHETHHQIIGNLDRRFEDNITIYTETEFSQLSQKKQKIYRLMRHPVVFFVIGPLTFFVLQLRFANKNDSAKARRQVYYFDGLYLLVLLCLWQTQMLLLVAYYLLAMQIAGAFGLVLFYIQHNFESVYWADADTWTAERAAMENSSYLVLPGWASWLIGWINYHHIHHLHAGIPNYRLPEAHRYAARYADYQPKRIYLRDFSRCFALKVIDENQMTLTQWPDR